MIISASYQQRDGVQQCTNVSPSFATLHCRLSAQFIMYWRRNYVLNSPVSLALRFSWDTEYKMEPRAVSVKIQTMWKFNGQDCLGIAKYFWGKKGLSANIYYTLDGLKTARVRCCNSMKTFWKYKLVQITNSFEMFVYFSFSCFYEDKMRANAWLISLVSIWRNEMPLNHLFLQPY